MVWMGRMVRGSAAALAGLALMAMPPAPCPCPEETAAPRSGHECCAPPVGVSADDHGCCDDPGAAEADLQAPGPVPMPSLGEAAVARVELARFATALRGPAFLAPSPPPLVLRI
jgi:hypothetical protein